MFIWSLHPHKKQVPSNPDHIHLSNSHSFKFIELFSFKMADDLTEPYDGGPWNCCNSVATLYDDEVPSETPAYAVVSGNLTQARELAASGAYDRPSDAWTIYEACLQGN